MKLLKRAKMSQSQERKAFFIHYFCNIERKWRKAFRMCLTYAEASYNMELLQRNDKHMGKSLTYRIACVNIHSKSMKQLELY